MLTPLPLLLRDLGQPPLAYGLLIAANGALIVGHRVRPSVVTAAVAMLVVTAGEMLYKPTATAHVADSAPAGMTARYQSLYGAASLGGMLLAPVLGGWAYERWPILMWPVCGVLAGGAALALAAVSRRTAPKTPLAPPADHEPGVMIGADERP